MTLSQNRLIACRRGFSLLELMAVLVALIILGAILIPTLTGLRGDTRTKAGVDVLQTFIAKAREKAVEDGFAYRLAISADGKRVRISPDSFESTGEMPTIEDDEHNNGPTVREDDFPVGIEAHIMESDDSYRQQDQSGWMRVATFMPDGTCKEDSVAVQVSEKGVTPVTIRVRGVTGTCVVERGGSTP